jgi:hypothetical protein
MNSKCFGRRGIAPYLRAIRLIDRSNFGSSDVGVVGPMRVNCPRIEAGERHFGVHVAGNGGTPCRRLRDTPTELTATDSGGALPSVMVRRNAGSAEPIVSEKGGSRPAVNRRKRRG